MKTRLTSREMKQVNESLIYLAVIGSLLLVFCVMACSQCFTSTTQVLSVIQGRN